YKARYGEKPNYHAGTAYAATQVFEASVKKAGNFDNVQIRTAMSDLKMKTIMGTFDVNDQGLNKHQGLTFQIQDGQRVIIWPPHLAEGKARLPMPKWSDR
ncbi:MAG: ABC transporter substrate-binding protein, partial [bacterium]